MGAQNVLVVEDDRALSDLVGGLLTEAGYRPVTIKDHTLIAAAVDLWKPRLVILDGEVGSTGEGRDWDDAAAIRRAHPTLPVVMFTADRAAVAEARTGQSGRSRAAGFAGIVSKPFVVEEFLATVNRAAERRASVGAAAPPTHHDDAAAEAITVFPDVGKLAPDWPETDLFGTIVHELRGPLTVIRGQAQLARRRVGQDPERERAAIDLAIEQVDRMQRLVTDLLDFSGIRSNGISLKIVALDLVAAVVDAIGRHEYGETRRISFQWPHGAMRVRGDPDRIAQILDNLLGNALKYSAAEAPIEVSLTMLGGEAQVRIADHGVGVPADERAMLFTPFYRSPSTRGVRGTGLGLHISKRLAERHRGRLWLEASSEAGSVFVLALPLTMSEGASGTSLDVDHPSLAVATGRGH